MEDAGTTRLEAFSDLLAVFAPRIALPGIAALTLYWMIFPGRHR